MQLSIYKHLRLDLNCIARDVESSMCQHSGDVLGVVGNLKKLWILVDTEIMLKISKARALHVSGVLL